MVDDLFGNEMRVQYLQVLIGDDEGDVVALTQDVLDEGVVTRVAHHALHGVYPEGHFVLFLLPQAAGHVVGEQQGQRHHRHSDDDGYDPLAEREYFAPQFEHSRLFLFGRLHGRDFLVFRRIFQHFGSPENLGVVTQVMFDHAGLIAVTQNDVVVDRFGDLFPIGMQIGLRVVFQVALDRCDFLGQVAVKVVFGRFLQDLEHPAGFRFVGDFLAFHKFDEAS